MTAMFCMTVIFANTVTAYSADKTVINEKYRVTTTGCYKYRDMYNTARIEIPKIINKTGIRGVAEVNKEVRFYTNGLIGTFEANIVTPAEGKNMPTGFHSFETTWAVIVNSPAWFTLKISSLEIMAGGSNFYKYYNIDKATGEYVKIGGLFKEGSDYIGIISRNIISQMMARMDADEDAVYWIAGDNAFIAIKPDQNYYFNDNGELVIVFDEYEVAPGSMGSPEFVIPGSAISDIKL